MDNTEFKKLAIDKGLIALGDYVDKKTPVEFKCSYCGKEFSITPTALRRKKDERM